MKLKQGDYLPVSEIKTEQDFNNVIKAAKGTYNFESQAIRTGFNYVKDTYPHGFICIAERNLVINYETELDEFDNKLTLPQWLEKGGVKPESKEFVTGEFDCKPVLTKEVKLFNGQECIVLFEGKNQSVIQYLDDTGTEDFVFTENIKPLKSKADQERRKAIEEMIEVNRPDWELSKEVVGKLYDAGYRKVKPLRKEDLLCSPNLRCATTTFGWLRDNGHILVTEGE